MKARDVGAAMLEAWFDRSGRSLPWRADHDPYHVLLAEFILQQTRMETGLRYYGKLLERFPTMEALAAAPVEEVLAAWSGLGYYSRARNLHATARRIVSDFAGRVPSDAPTLRELPGIGPYTAGAIASIAFNRPEPSLDGNQFRVLGRVLGFRDVDSAAKRRHVETLARTLLGAGRPRIVNQALMDLGSLVCLPEAPRCSECPLTTQCELSGRVTTRPRRTATPVVVLWEARIHRRAGAVWLAAPRPSGLLAGLWLPPMRQRSSLRRVDLEHQFSHRRWRIRLAFAAGPPTGEGRWVRPDELGRLPHSALTVRLMRAALARPPLAGTGGGASRSPAAKVRLR